ncbi:hypothetical protein Tco_1287231 [Tanacetum coccineum]
MYKCASWLNVIERFNNRLYVCKGKLLSIGGCYTLTKVVLGSLPLYYLLVSCAPCKVKWKAVLADCDKGGLEIGSIKAKNISLLGEWWWRFLSKKDVVWRKVIAAIHGVNGGFFEGVSTGLKKDVWKSIISCGAVVDDLNVNFQSSFNRTIGNGNNILFWKDIWLCSGVHLKDRFPRLYALKINKNASLSERWCCFNGVWAGSWSWRINLRGRSKSDLELLASYLQWVELRVCVEDGLLWSINVASIMFPLCGEVPESIDHILVHCLKVKPIWLKCFSWWNLNPPHGDLSIKSLIDGTFCTQFPKLAQAVLLKFVIQLSGLYRD